MFTLYFLVKLANDLRKQKLKYFKDAWNVLEFIMLSLCVTSIVMYGLKKAFATVAMDVLHDSDSGEDDCSNAIRPVNLPDSVIFNSK